MGITRIEGLIVTNYDEDHVSGIENLFENVSVPRIFRNRLVTPMKIRDLKSDTGMGRGIEFLVNTTEDWGRSGVTVSFEEMGLSGVHIRSFMNSPNEFDDENNLSMICAIDVGGLNLMFTGDMEIAGWKQILSNFALRSALAETDVFFASHHGRESGCCEEVFHHCRPTFVVISDKSKGFQSQETTDWYRTRSDGGYVNWSNKLRNVLTTRSDGNLVFHIDPASGYNVEKY